MPANTSKLRQSCDYCHSRELKCSGELSGCERCKTLNIQCAYSARVKRQSRAKNTQQKTLTPPSEQSSSTTNNMNDLLSFNLEELLNTPLDAIDGMLADSQQTLATDTTLTGAALLTHFHGPQTTSTVEAINAVDLHHENDQMQEWTNITTSLLNCIRHLCKRFATDKCSDPPMDAILDVTHRVTVHCKTGLDESRNSQDLDMTISLVMMILRPTGELLDHALRLLKHSNQDVGIKVSIGSFSVPFEPATEIIKAAISRELDSCMILLQRLNQMAAQRHDCAQPFCLVQLTAERGIGIIRQVQSKLVDGVH